MKLSGSSVSFSYLFLATAAAFFAGWALDHGNEIRSHLFEWGSKKGQHLEGQEMVIKGNLEPLVGFWMGTLAGDLHLLYRVTKDGVATYSLDQGGALIPAGFAEYDETTREVEFDFPTIAGIYKATLDQTGNILKGKWSQLGRKIPLTFHRYQSENDEDQIPREFRYLVRKILLGETEKIVEMAGFWSGYLKDDEEDDDSPELVILEIENIADDLVEPKLWLPDESFLPFPIRTLGLTADGMVKAVAGGEQDAVFEGQLLDKKITGHVYYVDVDYAPPLELVWSKDRPKEVSKMDE